MIGPILSLTVSHATQSSLSAALTLSASSVIKDFFHHLFLYPEKHKMALMVMAAIVIGSCVGLAFLIKMVYEKCCPERQIV